MAYPHIGPQTEAYVYAIASSAGSTAGTAIGICPVPGIIKRVGAAFLSSLASTMTITVQVDTSSTDICSAQFTVASGTASVTGTTFELVEVGSTGRLGGITVNEGSVITFSPTTGACSGNAVYFAAIHIRG